MASRPLDDARAARLLSAVSEDRVEWMFTGLLVAFVGVLLWTTLGYERFARIIPLMVGVPTFALLLVVWMATHSDRVRAFLARHQIRDVVDIEGDVGPMAGAEATEDGGGLYDRRVRFLAIAAWILGFTLLFVFVGIVESVLIFLLGYYRFASKLSVPQAVAYAIGVVVFVFIVFDLILEMRFFENSVFSFLLP